MGPRMPHRLNHVFDRFSSSPSSPRTTANIIPSTKAIEEETLPKYNAHAFYPARFGEVLNNRYQIVAKLGYGTTATVWLAKDQHCKKSPRYVTVKININKLTERWLQSRREISERLQTANPQHPGFQHIRFSLETFKITGPHGTHLCIIYDPLREPIGVYMEKFKTRLFNNENLKLLLPSLLQALDYLHSECRVVHTDLKPDNIMMGVGDPSVLETFVQDEINRPSPRKKPDQEGRIIYQSRSDFRSAETEAIIRSAKIIDIGLAAWGDESHNTSIQSNAFTAPEVILTAGWSYPADIWNLGVMLWDLFENFGLFDTIDTSPGSYRCEKHLGLMIALMGPPPKTLLERGSTSATYFDQDGNFRNPKLIPKDLSFEISICQTKGEEKELFIDFAKKMLCWLPEERWTAKQLLEHPWLKRPENNQMHEQPIKEL